MALGTILSNIFTDAPLVTPTEAFFLEGYEASKEAATDLFSRIRRLMGVSKYHVRLKFEKEDPNPILWWDGTRYSLLLVNIDGSYVSMQPAGTYSSSWSKHCYR